MDPEQRSERSGIHPRRGREADPRDERRRIQFAAAEDASGGRGGHEVERSETSVSPAFTTRREASHLLAKGGPGGCAASTPQLNHDACGVGFLAELEGRPSTRLLPLALTALDRLAHRGAVDADGRTGDGAGVTTQIPYDVLRSHLEARGLGDLPPADLAVGLVFLPAAGAPQARARRILEDALVRRGLRFLGWRPVPVREDVLGEKARRSQPAIAHLLVGRPTGSTLTLSDDELEAALYRVRRDAEARAAEEGMAELHVASLSRRSLVYKALVRGVDLADFYPDLRHPGFATAFVVFHQRFSTNTLPSWTLTQPFRLLAHNGEINTIQGNRSGMRAREASFAAPRLGLAAGELRPLLPGGGSDSASLDEALALLTVGGRDACQAMTLLVPPAWENDSELAPAVRAFFEYQSCLMEPWDGPALVVFTDGRVVGAALDRNGLRPARTALTADGLVLVASEAGVLDVEDDRILHRGRLGPGDMVAVDLAARRFLDREAIHRHLAARKPYAEWLRQCRVFLGDVLAESAEEAPEQAVDAEKPPVEVLRAFGYTREEMQLVLAPMFREGREPLGSMGDDTPLAVLSGRPRLLFSYFKQRFAQVTNPPIDPLRESLVMSLAVHLGPRGDILGETAEHAAQVHLAGPLLQPRQLEALVGWPREGWRPRRLSLLFPAAGGATALRAALEALLADAARAVEEGAALLVLSDRGVEAEQAALPSLLAVSAVHQHLVRRGLRMRASLVVETGEARDDHQVAALVTFGAEAVCPYLALKAVEAAAETGSELPDAGRRGAQRYLASLEKGLLKIISKMGISTLRSYHGAQLMEIVGLADELVAAHFSGTASHLGGADLEELANDVLSRHREAFASAGRDLDEGSLHRYRQKGEAHAFEPRVVKALHAAMSAGGALEYRRYAELVHARAPLAVRDLLEVRTGPTVPLAEVEPVEAIFPRFMTAAMSLGALSPEAQHVLAIAMNRIGGRSNSGEGGEPAELHWQVLPGGDRAANRIKQVASARFGVTAPYLMSADELQIKMAQGSKPGEGGQLPGHKVAPHIARVRHSTPGVTLISPPPHHDIYSIEDLAQLVYDLKRVNPAATVSVKLVSTAGVGTIAAGVAKAHADAIQISGHDGGTGASPLGSIKNAGTPWEIGLAEAQQVLSGSGLRSRVRLQVDGGLKTGRDVVIAALLGAEAFGFGSAALVAAGCVMARQCHLNTCPAGIATQREELRRRFTGTPEQVVRFFTAVAGEVREILALMGFRRLEDIVGRTDLLEARIPSGGRAAGLSLSRIIASPSASAEGRRCGQPRNDPPPTGGHLDEAVLARLRYRTDGPVPLALEMPITNADRAVGARVAGELSRRYRGRPLPPGRLRLSFRGSAGQSFAAFCIEGMSLRLEGEANDGVGKGMSGGELVLRPPRDQGGRGREAVIAGNAVLYGATGGRAFIAGRVGERFAVRNSGGLAIVEGTGDHACEYMTAGAAVILGPTGRNLGAGMSGGVAYVLDADGRLRHRHNPELVAVEEELDAEERAWLGEAIARHFELTDSPLARAILAGWAQWRLQFRRVAPREGEARVLPAVRAEEPAAAPVPLARAPRIAARGAAARA
ncbi:MAG: glutamate synthase large subunit [Acidobacteria bacterium]|nr:MAG: glutamate synthase large subunit [Acidobacteriota bacterium]PYQ22264.1 MAG: glutamate synthase large subunit [Acidobacteriota bacterium]